MLYLVPTFISDTTYGSVFPEYNKYILSTCKHFAVENSKNARSFLKQVLGRVNFEELSFYELGSSAPIEDKMACYEILLSGLHVAVLSDAGMPGIADPGKEITIFAHKNNIAVQVLVGPSSIFLALAGSGLCGQNFEFHGYLPIDSKQLISKIAQLEMQSRNQNKTQIFIETPYRSNKIFEVLLNNLSPNVLLCVASNLIANDEFYKTMSIKDWRLQKVVLKKNPTTFLFFAY